MKELVQPTSGRLKLVCLFFAEVGVLAAWLDDGHPTVVAGVRFEDFDFAHLESFEANLVALGQVGAATQSRLSQVELTCCKLNSKG